MKRVLVTGSSGMLGTAVVRNFLADKQYSVIGLGRSFTNLLPRQAQILCDFSQPELLNEIEFDYDLVIHTAALTDLGFCERNPDVAEKVHVTTSGKIAERLPQDAKLVYISTDSVFDGTKGNYSEKDQPNPVNVYARTKLEGEQRAQLSFKNTTVVRTNIFGFHEPIKNSLAEWAFQSWANGKQITGYTDIKFNPVYVGQLAELLKHFVDHDVQIPLINIGSQEAMSKYEFLDLLRQKLNFDATLLAPTISDTNTTIRRPANTTLDVSILDSSYGAPSLKVGLDRWVSDFSNNNAGIPKNGFHQK